MGRACSMCGGEEKYNFIYIYIYIWEVLVGEHEGKYGSWKKL